MDEKINTSAPGHRIQVRLLLERNIVFIRSNTSGSTTGNVVEGGIKNRVFRL